MQNQNQNLEPIPIPPKQRWREFRIAYLPPLTFLILVALIAWMWTNYVQPGAIIGEVEMLHANVINQHAGTLQNLTVDYLQAVTNGQVLGLATSLDPDQFKAEVAAAEADLRLLKARMDLDKTRNLNSYGQLRVTLLDAKFDLDVARIRLQQAQAEFERAQKLLELQIIPRGVNPSVNGGPNGGLINSRNDFGYEVTVRDRDVLQAEVVTREKSVADLEQNLAAMEKTGVVTIDPEDAAVEQAIRAQRDRISQLQKPMVLRAPIDGFISKINHWPGEQMTAGSTVLVVSGRSSDHIVAWVHPPVNQKPRVGDMVEVRQMGLGQAAFEGTIVRVGSQLEPVSQMLSTPTANPERIDVGLPLLVQAEKARDLIPGEAVQVRIIRQAPVTAAN